MRGVALGFFDGTTGNRVARLLLDRVTLEYRHQGFLRVAWRPLVMLDGVTLESSAVAAWPAQGPKVCQTLRELAGRDELVLRHVRVCLAGSPALEITAPSARLRADGCLELPAATVTGATAPATTVDGCLWLTGPAAGRWMPAKSAATPMPSLPTAFLIPIALHSTP
jgi:hypothetical protein